MTIILKFNDISTRGELADFLNVPRGKLTHVLYVEKVDSYYESFEIPKKNGEPRHINAPTGDLKSIQKKLALALWEYQESIRSGEVLSPFGKNEKTSKLSHAFEKKKSIITNAVIHRNKRFVYNVDLENFFDSFHFGRVRGYFAKNRYFQFPNEVATVIAQLVCHNGCLPQGAPSSPIMTNLICQIFDYRILKIAKKYKLDYTRYADDLTFSTNNKVFLDEQEAFHEELFREVKSAGFSINNKKSRLQYKDSKQKVTGLVVNRKLSVDRKYCRDTRAMAHALYANGSFMIDGQKGTLKQLEGRFAFIYQLDKYNNKLECKPEPSDFQRLCRSLNSREKQYQKFLFYKYFHANDKPLVITEGKTDTTYLKAALKNLYQEYPYLISKKDDGEFSFNVSFLRRSDRFRYFFYLSPEGADSMTKLYDNLFY